MGKQSGDDIGPLRMCIMAPGSSPTVNGGVKWVQKD